MSKVLTGKAEPAQTKERPILFSAAMVRAILAGQKTQTRRVVSYPCDFTGNRVHPAVQKIKHRKDGWFGFDAADAIKQEYVTTFPLHTIRCPYGQSGDRLWVREEHYAFGHWSPVPGVKTKGGRMKWRFVADNDHILFSAPPGFRKGRHHHDPYTPAWHKRLARFMPRALSRITLEIVSVRVERVQEISEADALAEGAAIEAGHCYKVAGHPEWAHNTAVGCFNTLWNSIHGPSAFEQNPWVWVLEFRRVPAEGGQP